MTVLPSSDLHGHRRLRALFDLTGRMDVGLPLMVGLSRLGRLRLIGDSVFLFGVAAFTWFMTGLVFGWSYEPATRSLTAPAGAVRRPV